MGDEIKNLPTGMRVLMKADHPWAGYSGEVVRWEKTPFGIRPVIRLDNGQECFAMKPNQYSPVGGRRP